MRTSIGTGADLPLWPAPRPSALCSPNDMPHVGVQMLQVKARVWRFGVTCPAPQVWLLANVQNCIVEVVLMKDDDAHSLAA